MSKGPKALSRVALPLCGATTTAGTPCKRPAGAGTDHVGFGNCKHHGGSTRSGRKYAATVQVDDLLQHEYVGELDMEPHEALLMLVRRAARQVVYWSGRIFELEPDAVIVEQIRQREWTGQSGGSETTTSSSADLHIAVVALHAAEERLAKFAKLAIDAGVEERQVRVLEQFADGLAGTFARIFEALGLSEEQQLRAPAIVERELLLLEAAK